MIIIKMINNNNKVVIVVECCMYPALPSELLSPPALLSSTAFVHSVYYRCSNIFTVKTVIKSIVKSEEYFLIGCQLERLVTNIAQDQN